MSFFENVYFSLTNTEIRQIGKFSVVLSTFLAKLSSYADSKSLKIHTKVRDVEKYPPGNAPTTSTDDIDRQCGQG